jgi:hypothetical protein
MWKLQDEAQSETRVAFAGDWHGNGWWAPRALRRLNDEFRDVRTVLHVGDFGLMRGRGFAGYMAAIDEACQRNQIDRVLVTPGNHEDWDILNSQFADQPDQPVRCSERVWALPRGYRFSLGDRTFLSFGGAASVDYEYRTAGVDWWDSELPTTAEVERAIAAGPVDVMIAHDTVDEGTPKVQLQLAANPQGWPVDALAYSALSRARVTEVWGKVRPAVLVHGHMHIADQIRLADDRQVISLGCDDQPGNVGVLDLRTLTWKWGTEAEVVDV